MTRTVTRLFDTHTDALRAVEMLERMGVPQSDIAIVSNNHDDWHGKHRHGHDDHHGRRHDRDDDNETAEGAGKGATTGGLIGGAGGLLAGLGMLAIPGLGPVVAAGWLASTAVGAAIGAAAGGVTGGLLGALKDAGHSDEEANVYAEGVRRGGTLVSVQARDGDAGRIERTLQEERGVDATTRGSAYRQSGWSRFDDKEPAWSRDQIELERNRHRNVDHGRV